MTGPAFLVRPLAPGDHPSVLRIAADLPRWFTEQGRTEIRADLGVREGLAAVDGSGRCVGFLLHGPEGQGGRIHWMGVDPALHRRGIGAALVRASAERFAAAGAEWLAVTTLGDGVEYPPYAETRAFYRALGFIMHRREVHDDPECPESVVLRLALPRS